MWSTQRDHCDHPWWPDPSPNYQCSVTKWAQPKSLHVYCRTAPGPSWLFKEKQRSWGLYGLKDLFVLLKDSINIPIHQVHCTAYRTCFLWGWPRCTLAVPAPGCHSGVCCLGAGQVPQALWLLCLAQSPWQLGYRQVVDLPASKQLIRFGKTWDFSSHVWR